MPGGPSGHRRSRGRSATWTGDLNPVRVSPARFRRFYASHGVVPGGAHLALVGLPVLRTIRVQHEVDAHAAGDRLANAACLPALRHFLAIGNGLLGGVGGRESIATATRGDCAALPVAVGADQVTSQTAYRCRMVRTWSTVKRDRTLFSRMHAALAPRGRSRERFPPPHCYVDRGDNDTAHKTCECGSHELQDAQHSLSRCDYIGRIVPQAPGADMTISRIHFHGMSKLSCLKNSPNACWPWSSTS